ncbi:hypothetical protein BH20PSE1_BH20PSE1_01210 [soil metagenome]
MSRIVITSSWADVPHLSAAEQADLLASFPAHERDARSKGVPILGSGRVFPVDEALITELAFPIPAHWPRICGMDFGWDHPTAAVWIAWDRDADVVHVYDAYRSREQLVPVHAAAIKPRGAWIPVAWPHDGNNDTAVGPQLAKQYRTQGVNMRPENAKFPPDARDPMRSRISVEAGLQLMLTRMQTGRFKVAAHLNQWFEEFRLYHRDEGKVVKVRDDILCAARTALMDLRFAACQQPVKPLMAPYRPLDAVMGI